MRAAAGGTFQADLPLNPLVAGPLDLFCSSHEDVVEYFAKAGSGHELSPRAAILTAPHAVGIARPHCAAKLGPADDPR